MIVRATVTMDIDVKAWMETYGLEDKSEVRDDVRHWLVEMIMQTAPADEGAITNAELR